MNREPSVFPVAPATVFPAESKPGVPDGLCDQRGAPMSTPDHDSIARESLQAENESLRARATQAEQERDAAEAARDEVFAVIERQHVQSSDQQVNEELHAARAEVVALTQERDAAHATLGSMDKELEEYISDVLELSAERDAYKRAKSENDERFMLERDVARADSRIWEKIAHRECQRVEATQAEVVALRTALETINVGTNDKWVLAIARAALGSTTEPEETRGEADDVGRRPPTTTPNPSHMEARGGRPWDIFKREAQ